MYAVPNYSHAPLLQNTIAGGTSSIDVAVAQQPESETVQPTIWRPKGELLDFVRGATLNLLAGVITVAISGCVGPPVLERQVLGYDEVTKMLDEKLLLLNIARVSNQEPVHFTSTSSIAATFNWTATLGASGEVTESKGTNFFNLNIGGWIDFDEINDPDPHRCVSVGFLVKENERGKVLVPTVADLEHPENRHVHGGIMIPTCSIVSERRLTVSSSACAPLAERLAVLQP